MLPMRRAFSFRRACVISVSSAEFRWLTLDPGPFTFVLWAVSAASPLLLIRLPHCMILISGVLARIPVNPT
jgi:hypothetical protein